FHGADAKDVSIRDVSCLGRCDQAPAFMVNDHIYANVDSRVAASLVQDAVAGRPLPESHHDGKRMPVASDPYNATGQHAVVRRFIETRHGQEIIAALKAGALRGMGGAGFPTSSKWELVRNAPGETKYIVCNADESEPGTIKDRGIMENVPYLVI